MNNAGIGSAVAELAIDRCQHAFEAHGLAWVPGPGDGARAQAPGHSTADRSVSFHQVQGRVLMHSFADEKDQVLGAVGLSMRDLFDDPDGIRYRYPDGRVVHRSPDKKFRQSGNTKGAALYHGDRIEGADTVYFVEGEDDVHAIESVDAVAVTAAQGAAASTNMRVDLTPLSGKHVLVIADKDEPGRAHAQRVAAALRTPGKAHAASVRIVEARVGKDAADHIAAGYGLDEFVPVALDGAADESVPTMPWPILPDAALAGVAGRIVGLVAPHTEADPAAILVQLLAVLGAAIGPDPYLVAGNDKHHAVIHPLIVGRTNNGAKGTSLGVVEAIRKKALPLFDSCVASGLSSAEGLIEMVRDGTPADEATENNHDPGVTDKRLLVKETEYKAVLARSRREGNTLGTTLRQAWDGGTLRTLTRKHNRLTATDAHIVVIGHITPREFRATLSDSDLSGGSVNRMLICLSRRSRLHTRLGNIPDQVITEAAEMFKAAHESALPGGKLGFTRQFWTRWDSAYYDLNRDKPDSWATDATARGVSQVLRLALLYALFDSASEIDSAHLDAALALWAYAEHSAKWLFSTHELEVAQGTTGALASFIVDGGRQGRSRTEISRDYFKGNAKGIEITAELAALVHDGTVIETKDETGPRTVTRYMHRTLRTNEFTNHAGQHSNPATNPTNSVRTDPVDLPVDPSENSSQFVDSSSPETFPELQSSSNSLIRSQELPGAPSPYSPVCETTPSPAPPGGLTATSPGQSDRVQQITAKHQTSAGRSCPGCGTAVKTGRVQCQPCYLKRQGVVA